MTKYDYESLQIFMDSVQSELAFLNLTELELKKLYWILKGIAHEHDNNIL